MKQLQPRLIILLLAISTSIFAQEKSNALTLSYYQKLHLTDFNNFENLQDASLPLLSDNARFHGMKLEGVITNNFVLGLYATGALKDNKNSVGYTSWGGGLGAATIAYRKNLFHAFSADAGCGLGCGRFTYESSAFDGSRSINSTADAIFWEPYINLKYTIKEKFVLSVEASYMLDLFGNEYSFATQTLPNPFPNGWVIGASIGYKFSFLDKK